MAAFKPGQLATAVAAGERSPAPGSGVDDLVAEMYASEYRFLVRLAVLLVCDVRVAEDLVQDAFIAMHGGWRWMRDSDKARAYLRRTVVHGSRSVLRHPRPRHAVSAGAARPWPGRSGARPDLAAALEQSAVVSALRELSERQREALVLRYYADLSEADMAMAMGISKRAVARHIAQGAASLRAVVEATTTQPSATASATATATQGHRPPRH